MAKRDLEKTRKIRIAVGYLLERGHLSSSAPDGIQSQLAKYFMVSRQRVHQIVVEERRKIRSTQSHIPQAS